MNEISTIGVDIAKNVFQVQRRHIMSLELYTWPTPNGHKPQILLEELDVPYDLRPVNIYEGEQFSEAFFRINPNRRIPA